MVLCTLCNERGGLPYCRVWYGLHVEFFREDPDHPLCGDAFRAVLAFVFKDSFILSLRIIVNVIDISKRVLKA